MRPTERMALFDIGSRWIIAGQNKRGEGHGSRALPFLAATFNALKFDSALGDQFRRPCA